jgi:hypothetical protein
MDVIGFLCVSLGSSTVKLHDSLGTRRAQVQKLVSVVKMVTALEDSITERQLSVMCFFFVGERTQCKGYS